MEILYSNKKNIGFSWAEKNSWVSLEESIYIIFIDNHPIVFKSIKRKKNDTFIFK